MNRALLQSCPGQLVAGRDGQTISEVTNIALSVIWLQMTHAKACPATEVKVGVVTVASWGLSITLKGMEIFLVLGFSCGWKPNNQCLLFVKLLAEHIVPAWCYCLRCGTLCALWYKVTVHREGRHSSGSGAHNSETQGSLYWGGYLALWPRSPLSTFKCLTLVSVLLAPQAWDILDRELLVDVSQEEKK